MRTGTLLVAAAALLIGGCGDSATEVPNAAVGTYTLTRVNQGTLPYLAEEAGSTRVEVLSGSLVLRVDGGYAGNVTWRISDGSASSTQQDQSAGTFTVTSQGIEFREAQSNETYAGALSGTTLSVARRGITFAFEK